VTEAGRYRLEFSPDSLRHLRKLDRAAQIRIKHTTDRLCVDPRPNGVVKLGGLDNVWRVRTGDFRIIYSIFDEQLLVSVIWVGNRRDAY
jgi:mRNA interferase RelE/StbE